MAYETILTEIKGAVGIITLNRPQALNALSNQLQTELNSALSAYEDDDAVRVIVLTGSEKAFAAGADIKEMVNKTFVECYQQNFITSTWERLTQCRKPTIAAVSGFALGGGAEMAMMCDLIIAADNAKFGQPEVTIGTIPGAGATQRLTRAVGKAKAMDMILTGRMIDAVEAERIGLVSRIVPLADLLTETLKAADKIASLSAPVIRMAKESVNHAFNSHLTDGISFERKLFYATFSLADQKEGMAAFSEKRPPNFTDK